MNLVFQEPWHCKLCPFTRHMHPGTEAQQWLIRTDALLALQVSWCSAGTVIFKSETEARQAKLLSSFHSHNCQPQNTQATSSSSETGWRPSLSCSQEYWPLGLIPPQVNQPFLLVFLVLAGLLLVFLLLFLAWNHTHAQPITTKSSHPQKCHCLKSHKDPISTEVLTPTEIPLLPETKANFYESLQTHRHVT